MASQIENLGLVECFDRKIHIPNLTKKEILNVLNYEDGEYYIGQFVNSNMHCKGIYY